jgi:hypothetical protein
LGIPAAAAYPIFASVAFIETAEYTDIATRYFS